MALDPLATVEELEAWLGAEVPGSSIARADAVLAAASTLVRSETGRPWVDATGDPETFDEHHDEIWDALRTVTLQCAGRVWRNPQGAVQTSTGPFADTFDRRAGEGLYLTSPEKSMLVTAVGYATGGESTGLWTLGTTRGNLETARCVDGVTGDPWTTIPW